MQLTGQSTFQTGDVNLASALMACSIPLDRDCPVKLIESTTRDKPYGSFLVCAISEDGMEDTQALMEFWTNGGTLRDGHPLPRICEFIKAKPNGILSPDEWLDHAVDWLKARSIPLPGLRRMSDVPAFVQALPQSLESYILAFVYNRWTCFQLYNNARRAIHQSRGDQLHTLIDSRLPKHQRNELLARLEG